jgi:hypothetical protein
MPYPKRTAKSARMLTGIKRSGVRKTSRNLVAVIGR